MPSESRLGVILVVEDDWLLRDDIVHHLKDAGWEVLEASTGEGAIGQLEGGQQKIDVLLTDIQLAGYLSGWDVAQTFRAAQPEMPVIYASGNAVDQSRAVTGSLFFRKPAKVSDILAALSRL